MCFCWKHHLFLCTRQFPFLFCGEYNGPTVDLVLNILIHWNSGKVIRRWNKEKKNWKGQLLLNEMSEKYLQFPFSLAHIYFIIFGKWSRREKGITLPSGHSIYSTRHWESPPWRRHWDSAFLKRSYWGGRGSKGNIYFPKDMLVLKSSSLFSCQ